MPFLEWKLKPINNEKNFIFANMNGNSIDLLIVNVLRVLDF